LLRPSPATGACFALLAALALATPAPAATPSPDPSPTGAALQPDPFPVERAAPVVRTPVALPHATFNVSPFVPPVAVRVAHTRPHARTQRTVKQTAAKRAATPNLAGVFRPLTTLLLPTSTVDAEGVAEPRVSRMLALALGMLVLLSATLVAGVARAARR
jgi:hypothetical protein